MLLDLDFVQLYLPDGLKSVSLAWCVLRASCQRPVVSIWPLIGDVKFNHLLRKHLQNCLSLKMLFSPSEISLLG